jgi:ADP-heptose:LPS heptosyltransferase
MNLFIKARVGKLAKEANGDMGSALGEAGSALFAVFSRYGDGIIAFKVIAEFVEKYPNKKYLLVTTKQLAPYAKELLNIEVAGVNKRNPLSFVSTLYRVVSFNADIGLNPWSHGDDSLYFISFAKKFFEFKNRSHAGKTANLYDRVREYLAIIKPSNKTKTALTLENAKNILVCPTSTDIIKSLNDKTLAKLIEALRTKHADAKITVAINKNEKELTKNLSVDAFVFKKNEVNSKTFLELIKSSDLFVGVDAGPLHIALALGKPTIGVFGPTSPQTVLDDSSSLIVWRDASLCGIFCNLGDCKLPICMDKAINSAYTCNSPEQKLVIDHCPLK